MLAQFFDLKQYRVLQVSANLLVLLIWYFANDGLAFWDDFTYLNFANEVNQGTFQVNENHFTSRVGIIYPVAWLIQVFGISSHSITLFPLIAYLVIINLVFWYGDQRGHWVGVISAVFLLCDYRLISYSSHLFPEVPLTVAVLGALLCYDAVNRRVGDYRLLGLFASLFLFGAFLIKTSIFMLGPLFLFLFVNDYLRRMNIGFWRITIALSVFFFVLHGLWYVESFGDFFYRFQNISNNHEATSKTFFDKEQVDILKRLTYLPFLGFLQGGFFIPLLFGLPAMLTIKRKDWSLNDPKKLWPISAIFIILTWWFISTNWKYYSPMPVDMRHLTFVIPILVIAGAHYWTEVKLGEKLLKSSAKWLLAGLLIIPAFKISKARNRNFEEVSLVVDTYFVQNSDSQRIITDGLISYGHPYFYKFKNESDDYQWWVELDFSQVKADDYLLVNESVLNDRYEEPGYLQLLKNSISAKGLQLNLLEELGEVKLYIIQ